MRRHLTVLGRSFGAAAPGAGPATPPTGASNDATGTLFPEIRPLLQVDLPRKLDGQPITGAVKSMFALPQRSVCTDGTFEAEGVDHDTHRGTLRAAVIPPGGCAVATAVSAYRQVTG